MWSSTCRTFLSHLNAHINDLKFRLKGVKGWLDDEIRICLQCASIISLTALAQLSYVVALNSYSIQSHALDSFSDCIAALRDIVVLFEELGLNGMFCLDPAMGVRIIFFSSSSCYWFNRSSTYCLGQSRYSKAGQLHMLMRCRNIIRASLPVVRFLLISNLPLHRSRKFRSCLSPHDSCLSCAIICRYVFTWRHVMPYGHRVTSCRTDFVQLHVFSVMGISLICTLA